MEMELPVQQDTCKSCGMPFGRPVPELSASRSYCERCANLPGNIMAILEVHARQMSEKSQEIGSSPSSEVPAK